MRCTLRDGKYGMLFHVNIQCSTFKYLCNTSVLKSYILKNYYKISAEKQSTATMYSIWKITDENVTHFHIIILHIQSPLTAKCNMNTAVSHKHLVRNNFFNVFLYTRIVAYTYFSCFEKSELSWGNIVSLLLEQNVCSPVSLQM